MVADGTCKLILYTVAIILMAGPRHSTFTLSACPIAKLDRLLMKQAQTRLEL